MLRYLRSKTVWGYVTVAAGWLVRTQLDATLGDELIAAGIALAGVAHKSNADKAVKAASARGGRL